MWGHVAQPAWPVGYGCRASFGRDKGALKQGQRRCKGGFLLPAAPCPLMSHLLGMCHSFLDGSPGWEWWAEWQSRSSVLSVPWPSQGRAWLSCWQGLGAQSWDLTGSTFFFTQPRHVRQHLSLSLDNTVCFRPVSLARKKICFKKTKI